MTLDSVVSLGRVGISTVVILQGLHIYNLFLIAVVIFVQVAYLLYCCLWWF